MTASSPPTPPIDKPNGLLVRFATNPREILHAVLHHLARIGPALRHELVPLVGLSALVIALGVSLLVVQRHAWRRGGHFVTIAPPALPNARGGLALWQMLAPLLTSAHAFGLRRPPVAFECRGDDGGLTIGVWVARTLSPTSIAAAIETAWPGARTTITDAPPPLTGTLGVGRALLGAPEWFALGGTDALDGDPLRAVFGALVDAAGTSALFQVLARPAATRRIMHARHAALSIRRGEVAGSRSAIGALRNFTATPSGRTAGRTTTNDPLALADVRVVTAKVNDGPHFEVAVRYAVAGGDGRGGARLRRRRLRQLGAALGLFTGRNRLVGRYVLLRRRAFVGGRRLGRGFLCSTAEMGALAHLPAEPSNFGMAAAPARTVAPPRDVSANA